MLAKGISSHFDSQPRFYWIAPLEN